MNRQMTQLLVGVGLVCGAVGYFTGVLVTDGRLRKEYEESARSYRRAMELTEVKAEAPSSTEALLEEVTLHSLSLDLEPGPYGGIINTFDADAVAHKPAITNPYHVATTATATAIETFVNGEVNVYGISYIEEEEYLEDDGRAKYSVTIVMDAHNPTFFMDGLQIEDWDTRLGASIVVDFLDRVPPGINPVLYVRNHKTEEDYELTPEHP